MLVTLMILTGFTKVEAKETKMTVSEGQFISIPYTLNENYDLADISIKLVGNLIPDETIYGYNYNGNINWNLDHNGTINLLACNISNKNYVKIYYKNKLIKNIRIKIINNSNKKGKFIQKWSSETKSYTDLDSDDYNEIMEMNSTFNIIFKNIICIYDSECNSWSPM